MFHGKNEATRLNFSSKLNFPVMAFKNHVTALWEDRLGHRDCFSIRRQPKRAGHMRAKGLSPASSLCVNT